MLQSKVGKSYTNTTSARHETPPPPHSEDRPSQHIHTDRKLKVSILTINNIG